LGASIQFVAGFTLLPWDVEAAARFRAYRQAGTRSGTLDLKIACITIEYDSTLLTRNTSDFAKVPGLRFTNWID
jgi:tRNA(fMet)-specific endonuclease VapC